MALPRHRYQPGVMGGTTVLISRPGPGSAYQTARDEWLFGPASSGTNAPAGNAATTVTAQTPTAKVAPNAGPASATSPTHVSTTTTSIGTFTNVHTFNLPATVNAGDHLLAVCSFGVDTVTPRSSLNGWTKIYDATLNAFHRWQIWERLCDGSEAGGTIVFDLGDTVKGTAAVCRITGAAASNGLDTGFSIGTAGAGFGTTPDPSSVTAAWGSAPNLYIAALTAGGGSPNATGNPTGYSNAASVTSDYLTAVASKQATSSSDDPSAFTIDVAHNWQAVTIAYRAAGPLAVSAQAPAASVKVNAGLATITFTAPAPTVNTTGTTSAPAGLATITFTVPAAAVTVKPNAGLATLNYTTPAPSTIVKPAGGLATITYTGNGVTTQTGWAWYVQISGVTTRTTILLDGTIGVTTTVT